ELAFVRIDSGDLLEEAHNVRRLLDELGNTNTGIVVTSDLDEYAIAALRSAPVDAYGVGTQLVTGSGAPTACLVYKLTTRQDHDVASAEVVANGTERNGDANHRPPLVKMVDGGVIDSRYPGASAVRDAAAHHRYTVSELSRAARRL